MHADLLGSGYDQVIVYDSSKAYIFGSKPFDLQLKREKPIPQEKNKLYTITLYPGGEYHKK